MNISPHTAFIFLYSYVAFTLRFVMEADGASWNVPVVINAHYDVTGGSSPLIWRAILLLLVSGTDEWRRARRQAVMESSVQLQRLSICKTSSSLKTQSSHTIQNTTVLRQLNVCTVHWAGSINSGKQKWPTKLAKVVRPYIFKLNI